MTKLSLQKISFAGFGGAAVLMIAVAMAAPADAATGRAKFRATPEELRRHCWRIDETFWNAKRRYGCGEVVRCAEGACIKISKVKRPPPPEPQPPLLTVTREPGRNGDGGGGDNGGRGNNGGSNGGKKGGGSGGSSSAAGGPN